MTSELRELEKSEIIQPCCDISKVQNHEGRFFDVWNMEAITNECKIDKNTCTDLLELILSEIVIKIMLQIP